FHWPVPLVYPVECSRPSVHGKAWVSPRIIDDASCQSCFHPTQSPDQILSESQVQSFDSLVGFSKYLQSVAKDQTTQYQKLVFQRLKIHVPKQSCRPDLPAWCRRTDRFLQVWQYFRL